MKKKLSLTQLNVYSFTTSVNEFKGGTALADPIAEPSELTPTQTGVSRECPQGSTTCGSSKEYCATREQHYCGTIIGSCLCPCNDEVVPVDGVIIRF